MFGGIVDVSIHAPVMDAKQRIINILWSQAVSIHAPVMDANFSKTALSLYHGVSIHAPVMDANMSQLIFNPVIKFQSTRP